jgi:hypothetical protein
VTEETRVRTATLTRVLAAFAALCTFLLTAGGVAFAHEERESLFPAGTGSTPTYRAFDADAPHLVVCKRDSASRIAQMADESSKAFNARLLGECGFEHIQAAVDAITERGTNIYVLPGEYREEPSHDENAPCTDSYDGGVVDYPLIVSCGEVINLITVAGDGTPDTREVDCNQLCDLQIEGTGERMEDVVVRGGFTDDGDWIKHNGLKADRADGFYVRNMTFELFRENAVYVHETDGYALERVNARKNDLYGILTFTSDHGLIKDCDTSFNGDSGVYPGSAADVNADNDVTGPLERFAVEITGCTTHHNALGFSGTAGNSVYFHDNEVHSNQAGYVTDSFVGGHPGMPQDHAWLENNRIYANNNNYVVEFVQSGICDAAPAERGYETGTVCPAFPVPVGTGVMIAGGSYNFLRGNQIYDNWRAGVKLFYVPGAVRGDLDFASQLDTSNDNHVVGNRFGFHPSGVTQPNGLDIEWDEQGVGNCWQDNASSHGELAHDAALPLPDCDSGGSLSPVGNVTKSALMVSCATYNREDMKDPEGCDWFDSRAQPEGRQEAPGEQTAPPAGSGDGSAGAGAAAERDGADAVTSTTTVANARGLPATGTTVVPALTGLVLGAAVLVLRRRARTSA